MHALLSGAVFAIALAYSSDSGSDGSAGIDSCYTDCQQAALLRIGMNVQVSERIRSGDMNGALSLLNSMNVLEMTPLLRAGEDERLVDMKRRVFEKLRSERRRMGMPSTTDTESIQLNKDIDAYLGRYPTAMSR
jgi:hypothetical protein